MKAEERLKEKIGAFYKNRFRGTPRAMRITVTESCVVLVLSGVLSPAEIKLCESAEQKEEFTRLEELVWNAQISELGALIKEEVGLEPVRVGVEINERSGEKVLSFLAK